MNVIEIVVAEIEPGAANRAKVGRSATLRLSSGLPFFEQFSKDTISAPGLSRGECERASLIGLKSDAAGLVAEIMICFGPGMLK
jgi:hypothetical protein